MASKKIVDGEVITNKKRFGLFPYTETLATFEAELLIPGQKLPTVVLPKFGDLRFAVSFIKANDSWYNRYFLLDVIDDSHATHGYFFTPSYPSAAG